jgi:hypothetical protein
MVMDTAAIKTFTGSSAHDPYGTTMGVAHIFSIGRQKIATTAFSV